MARWIWYPGDYELYHSVQVHTRRQEFGADYPAMWACALPHGMVEFRAEYDSPQPGFITPYSNGQGFISLDGGRVAPLGERRELPAGKHRVCVRVSRPGGLPCLYAESDLCPSSSAEWRCAHIMRESAVPGDDPIYESRTVTPETFPFAYQALTPTGCRAAAEGMLFSFERETFAQVRLTGADEKAEYTVYYGESEREALDTPHTLIYERVSGSREYTLRPRAFGYVYVRGADERIRVTAEAEYLPLEARGTFACSDELVQSVYRTAAYTFQLNCREFFLDGIKRDRWVWAGDAYQSCLINRCLLMDASIERRTLRALRGRLHMEEHINTILDYSLLWVAALNAHRMTFGDEPFIRDMLPFARALIEFVRARRDENGFVIGLDGEWVFVDWADIDKEGAVCAEQMLYWQALRVMDELCAGLGEDRADYAREADALKEKTERCFFDEALGAYVDSFSSGKRHVTRHSAILAILTGFADAPRARRLYENVLSNDSVAPVTTPYFKFFELDALCRLGHTAPAMRAVREYWGGMVRLGATTIWEAFDPRETGDEHYAMYGSRYGRSLCHAWGGGPIYLLARYVMGVSPTAPGFETFSVTPDTQALTSFEGTHPLPGGEVRVTLRDGFITVCASAPGGTLCLPGETLPLPPGECVTRRVR